MVGPKKPKVSVSITAYNQEPYIAQAIEGVLMQETDFPFEILIGEDQSSDRTREIVREYQRRHPDVIRLFLHDHPPDYVRVHGRRNFMHNLRHARGKYVALLDGDDFWIDRHKLSRQVAYLEANPKLAICFHRVLERDETRAGRDQISNPDTPARVFTLLDLLQGNFIHTCSVLFRNQPRLYFPEWFLRCPIGDWPMHIINATGGDIGFIPEVMSVYRVHGRSIWSSRNVLARRQLCLGMLATFDRYLNYKHHLAIRVIQDNMRLTLLQTALENDRGDLAAEYLAAILRSRTVDRNTLWQTLGVLGRDRGSHGEGIRRMAARYLREYGTSATLELLKSYRENGWDDKCVVLTSLIRPEKLTPEEQMDYFRTLSTLYRSAQGSGAKSRISASFPTVVSLIRPEKLKPEERLDCFAVLSALYRSAEDGDETSRLLASFTAYAKSISASPLIWLALDLFAEGMPGKSAALLHVVNHRTLNDDDRENYLHLLVKLAETRGEMGEDTVSASRIVSVAAPFGDSRKLKVAGDLCRMGKQALGIGIMSRLNGEKLTQEERNELGRLLSEALALSATPGEETRLKRILATNADVLGVSCHLKIAWIHLHKGRYADCLHGLAGMAPDGLDREHRADFDLLRYHAHKHSGSPAGRMERLAKRAIASIQEKGFLLTADAYHVASLFEDLNDLDSAVSWYTRVIRYGRGKSYLSGSHFHLARIFLKREEIVKTVEALEKCLVENPDHKKAKEMLKSLSER